MSLFILFALALADAVPARSNVTAARFECFVAAYPKARLKLWTDGDDVRVDLGKGRSVVWDDGREKSAQARIEGPDLEDTVHLPYLMHTWPPSPKTDPGRARSDAFFEALYGDSKKAARKNLRRVKWLPKLGGKAVYFNSQHGAAEALSRVSDRLEKLPRTLHKYVKITAGTFNWRFIHGTRRRSAHAYGIAIDINVKYTDYWRWNLKRDPDLKVYRNRIPQEIVEAFESEGFVWGGRWHHYDTMHFEYRPELFHPNCAK